MFYLVLLSSSSSVSQVAKRYWKMRENSSNRAPMNKYMKITLCSREWKEIMKTKSDSIKAANAILLSVDFSIRSLFSFFVGADVVLVVVVVVYAGDRVWVCANRRTE